MTPPDNRTNLIRNTDWMNTLPFNSAPTTVSTGTCPTGLCHESPKPNTLLPRPFFSDLSLQNRLIASSGFAAHKPVIAQVSPFLREEEWETVVANSNPIKNNSNNTQMPPEQAKIFIEKGNEFLKLAQKPGLRIEERLNHFHTALFNFQMLGDVENSKAILSEMLRLYDSNGNEFGKSYIQAQISFLQGDENGFSEAIIKYEQLDMALRQGLSGLPSESVEIIRGDLKNKLFIVYTSRAQLYSSEEHYQKATLDFEQALRLNPNKGTFQLYAQAAYRSGLFDFSNHDSQIEYLKFQRNFLPQEESTTCISHHQAPLSDFQIREREDKLRTHQAEVDSKIFAIQEQSGKNLEKFYEMMSLAYPSSNSAEAYEKDLVSAQFLEHFGRPEAAQSIYSHIMEEREGSTDSAEILRYVTASNYLAGAALVSSPLVSQIYADKSIQTLQGKPVNDETRFLLTQAKFILAESYLKNANLDAAKNILEDLRSSPLGEVGSIQYKLLGQIHVRLAQVYYSKKETFYLGDRLSEEIKSKFQGEAEVVGDTFFAKALSRVGTGRALEAVDILREEVQKPYPQSSAAQAIASDFRFRKFLISHVDENGQVQYLLKATAEINEGDWSEAFKVAVAKSGEGPSERKVAYAAAGGGGALAALALAPEPVATKVAAGLVAVGMGIGLLWERFVSADEHSDEIYDAYRTGISNISSTQNTMNMLMLGTDVAMLLTAGMAGSVAKAFVRESLAVTAEELTAKYVMGWGFNVMGDDAAVWLGRGILFAGEHSASGIASYAAYQAQKSLFFRQDFHWDSSEALQWVAMGGLIDGASRLPFLGTAAAELPLFQRGPLKNIIVNGKVVGQSTTEGLAAKWLVDAGFGLTAYYAWARPHQSYAEFMTQNLYMMGMLHAGGAVARKVTGGAPEAFISKIDRRANEAFARAKENILKDPPLNGGFGWQEFSYAGSGSRGDVSHADSRKTLDSTIFMRSDEGVGNGEGKEAVRFDLSNLSDSKKTAVQRYLGDKKLDSLTFKEQEKLIDHLLENERWSYKDMQALITPEGMKQFLGFGTEIPFGFSSQAQWHSFQKMLLTELVAAGVPINDPRVKILVQGSAVKGRDSKQNLPYRWEARPEVEGKFGQASDIDVAIVVDQVLFDQFVQRKIESIQAYRTNDPEWRNPELEWWQSIGPDGKIKRTKPAKKLERAIEEKRLDPYNLYSSLQQGHNRLRNMFPDRGIQLSVMLPESKFVPLPEDAMNISAALLVMP